MARLKVENAWVEFPVRLTRNISAGISRTGGRIDFERSVVTALQDISFELREGDRLGLMGHNGAGKSTMLRLLAGAYPPCRGRVTSVGRISTLFNTMPGLSMDGTGRENLITCGLQLGLSRRSILAKMDEIIEFAELGDYIDLPVRIYSAGMLTRLGFSIATSVDPEILLLDEGLATGDAQFAQKAEHKLHDLIARSSILVIASHSESLLANMCNRCVLLEHGRILSDGPAQSMIESYRASVVESARADDAEALHRAYVLATDMARRGERPPLDLEEQGLRYALTVAPDDAGMLQRYVSVLIAQNKAVDAELEARMILTVLDKDPSRTELVDRLRTILAGSPVLSSAIHHRAITATAPAPVVDD
ncbi:ABC transporter ATP-binding protein [Bradyrhizobium liaoningense]|uniref:ABC transporter ATP-binding protein n=1 Tax=Bradyrhizobium liaoningense TaxID=43992 RepID=UPI001BAE2D22|nr:ABC transporter ATP-binding protein [Bradyrhizobium liaoningense]MBR0856671.1 ABC transporter ATP-binding protein [Bradyrhizobium liaoningense]